MNKTFSASLYVGWRIGKTMPYHTLCKPPPIRVIPLELISKVCFTPRFQIFSPFRKTRRGRCGGYHSNEVATQRSGKIAKTLRDTANFIYRCVALALPKPSAKRRSDLEYLGIHLRPCSPSVALGTYGLRLTKLARIAAEDIFEMGSCTAKR